MQVFIVSHVSIITYKIYYLQCPETFKFCLNHWQTHFNLKLSNATLLWKRSNMILWLKKIVEEFYLNTSRFKNINQSIVIKYRTNYSIATINCSHLDNKWFFHTVSCFANDSEFCKFGVCWRGCKWLLSILMGEVNLTEFKNVKEVGKNIYSLFNFLNWLNCKLVRSLNKEWSLHASMWTKHCKAMIKAWANIITLLSMDITLLL